MANAQIVAVLITEGSKLISQMLRVKSFSSPEAEVSEVRAEQEVVNELPAGEAHVVIESPKDKGNKENKATAIATGCVPCSLGHLGTCTGLLNESVRFARGAEGMRSPEVVDRVNMCLDELNAMERVDLRTERINELTDPTEHGLAEKALSTSRRMRHKLEGLSSVTDLEQVAGATQTTRQEIGRDWFNHKLTKLSPEDRTEVEAKLKTRLISEK